MESNIIFTYGPKAFLFVIKTILVKIGKFYVSYWRRYYINYISYDINFITICMMELIDVEFHEQSNQIRIILYERKPFGCNKSHYTKKNWCPKLFHFVPLESDSPFKFGTLWFTTKRQWLTEFQSLLVQDYCLGTRINWINDINMKSSILRVGSSA